MMNEEKSACFHATMMDLFNNFAEQIPIQVQIGEEMVRWLELCCERAQGNFKQLSDIEQFHLVRLLGTCYGMCFVKEFGGKWIKNESSFWDTLIEIKVPGICKAQVLPYHATFWLLEQIPNKDLLSVYETIRTTVNSCKMDDLNNIRPSAM